MNTYRTAATRPRRWTILTGIGIGIGAPLLVSLTLLAFIALANGQPVSAWLPLLKLKECDLPCWIGITPGATPLGDARRQVETIYGDATEFNVGVIALLQDAQSRRDYRVIHRKSGLAMTLHFDTGTPEYDPTAVVQRIVIRPWIEMSQPEALPTVGDLHDILGTPDGLRLGSAITIPTLVVYYRAGQVALDFGDTICHRVDPHQPLRSVILFSRGFHDTPAGVSTGPWASHPWRGFGRCYPLEAARAT